MAYRLTQGESAAHGSRSAVVDALEVHALLEQVEAAPVHLSRPEGVSVERQLNGKGSGAKAAGVVRDALGVGLAPLQHVDRVIEQLVDGATVVGRPVGEDGISGMCVVTEGLSLVFVNTSKDGARSADTARSARRPERRMSPEPYVLDATVIINLAHVDKLVRTKIVAAWQSSPSWRWRSTRSCSRAS